MEYKDVIRRLFKKLIYAPLKEILAAAKRHDLTYLSTDEASISRLRTSAMNDEDIMPKATPDDKAKWFDVLMEVYTKQIEEQAKAQEKRKLSSVNKNTSFLEYNALPSRLIGQKYDVYYAGVYSMPKRDFLGELSFAENFIELRTGYANEIYKATHCRVLNKVSLLLYLNCSHSDEYHDELCITAQIGATSSTPIAFDGLLLGVNPSPQPVCTRLFFVNKADLASGKISPTQIEAMLTETYAQTSILLAQPYSHWSAQLEK